MKRRTLRQSESRDLAQRPDELAERLAAEEYGFQPTGSFDGETDSAVYEVKSTASTIEPGRDGRWRLFKDQHDELVQRDRDDTAWYIFVLFDVEQRPPAARLKRKQPAQVGRIIGARGGWFESGHEEKSQEKKLPIEAIF